MNSAPKCFNSLRRLPGNKAIVIASSSIPSARVTPITYERAREPGAHLVPAAAHERPHCRAVLTAPERALDHDRAVLGPDCVRQCVFGRSQHELEIFSHTSHQLRSPLTIARGHAELLMQSVGGTSSEAHVEIILQELDRVVMLAERLLVLSAAEDPDFLVPIETGIDTVVIEAAQRWHAAADRRWKVDCLDEALLTADVTRLMMAIDVLVENAVAHTGAGDEIAIGGRVEDGMATFVVSDTGRGMGPTDVTALIASLRERRPGGPRRAGGTGLGLQIARAVVEAHGGWLSLTSELGSGSTFALHVPLYPGGVAVRRDGYEPALRRA